MMMQTTMEHYQKLINQQPRVIRISILCLAILLITLCYYYYSRPTIQNLFQITQQLNQLQQQTQATNSILHKQQQLYQSQKLQTSKTTINNNDPLAILQSLLTNHYNLTLISFEKLLSNNNERRTKSFNLKFHGDYLTVMDYLTALEQLQLPILWQQLYYQVLNYPLAEINLSFQLIDNF